MGIIITIIVIVVLVLLLLITLKKTSTARRVSKVNRSVYIHVFINIVPIVLWGAQFRGSINRGKG